MRSAIAIGLLTSLEPCRPTPRSRCINPHRPGGMAGTQGGATSPATAYRDEQTASPPKPPSRNEPTWSGTRLALLQAHGTLAQSQKRQDSDDNDDAVHETTLRVRYRTRIACSRRSTTLASTVPLLGQDAPYEGAGSAGHKRREGRTPSPALTAARAFNVHGCDWPGRAPWT